MLAQPPLWFVILAFLAALGPLIIGHELGHYWVARWFGVGAEAFSIGFGKEIAGWTDKRGTRWKVGLLPLGGYVKFIGDDDPTSTTDHSADLAPELRSRSFHLRPAWQRFLIVLAGPATNFIIAILIFAAFFAISGMPRTASLVSDIKPGSAAQVAGIRPGDRIIAMADRGIDSFEELADFVALRPAEKVDIRVDKTFKPKLSAERTRRWQ